jgi:hypothetical protein
VLVVASAGNGASGRLNYPAAYQGVLAVSATDSRGGPRGVDSYYGHGLIDAYAALGGPVQPWTVPTQDALEPNNDGSRATPLVKAATATIAPEGDVDWYVTTLRRPARVRFDVVAPPYDAHTGPNLRPVAQLYDENLNRLVTDEPNTQRARIEYRLPAGLYYLRVANGCGARSAGTYSVSLSVHNVRGMTRALMPI